MTQSGERVPVTILPLLKMLIFTLLVPGTVTVWLPRILYPGQSRLAGGAGAVLGSFAIILGTAGYLRCAWDFAFTGRGTPAPIDPPKVLVARGLYRFVRNPIYLSVLAVLVGESLLFGSLALLRYAVIWFVIFYLFVVFYEEPALERKFGASYKGYRQRVRRWIPRKPPPD